jgi:large subunit ribosomal protein L21
MSASQYAVVKTGGKQYKASIGDVLTVEKLEGEPGDTVALRVLLMVTGEGEARTVTHDAKALASCAVKGTIVAHTKGPKIRIHKFKNKTGYHKRQGHRQPQTKIEITEITESGK